MNLDPNWGMNVKFDNTITLYEYKKKFDPQNAESFKNYN